MSYPWGVQSAPIIERAAGAVGELPQAVVGKQRMLHLVHARWAVMMALRGLGWSYPRIGRAVGDRDHTTIIHGVRSGSALVRVDPAFAALCLTVAA